MNENVTTVKETRTLIKQNIQIYEESKILDQESFNI